MAEQVAFARACPQLPGSPVTPTPGAAPKGPRPRAPRQGPPGPTTPSPQPWTCPGTSWALAPLRWARNELEDEPRHPLWQTPRRPPTNPQPPRPGEVP